jgi:hypothetical protein
LVERDEAVLRYSRVAPFQLLVDPGEQVGFGWLERAA